MHTRIFFHENLLTIQQDESAKQMEEDRGQHLGLDLLDHFLDLNDVFRLNSPCLRDTLL